MKEKYIDVLKNAGYTRIKAGCYTFNLRDVFNQQHLMLNRLYAVDPYYKRIVQAGAEIQKNRKRNAKIRKIG